MQITVKILNGQEVRLEVCGKSEKCLICVVEGLRPVRSSRKPQEIWGKIS